MTICKHCGTEIEDGLDYCPNCGQNIEETFGEFFDANEELEEEAYNIFDAPDEFDMDSLLTKEFEQTSSSTSSDFDFSAFSMDEAEIQDFSIPETQEEDFSAETEPFEEISTPEEIGLTDFFGASEDSAIEDIQDFSSEGTDLDGDLGVAQSGGIDFPEIGESDFMSLDDLFQDMDGEQAESLEGSAENAIMLDAGLEELLAASEEQKKKESGKGKKEKKAKEEKKTFFQMVFGNVPIDPSERKKELTPEQIAAKKQKKAEEKKAKAEERKLTAEEKKQIAAKNKAEKERERALAKEEKKAKKLEEAKKILEEMNETRINRLGATIVFGFFIVLAIVMLSGSDLFSYAISVNAAEKSFNHALNNNVDYYTDAYNEIYGLEIKPEDQLLNDKVMMVMYVNKQLNSYNSQMRLENYEAALHSLLLGLHRYGEYHAASIPLGVTKDLDFVRTQILKELEKTFGVSEDEAELLKDMLDDAGPGGIEEGTKINEDAARAYNLELYKIVRESGLVK